MMTTSTVSAADPGIRAIVTKATTPRDWREATSLLVDYFSWVTGAVGLESVEAIQPIARTERRKLDAVYGVPGRALLLARVGTLPAGIVALRPMPGCDAVELTRYYVRPVARGAGVGRRLLDSALTEAARLGYRRVVLVTSPRHMAAAVRLYEEVGFTRDSDSREEAVPGFIRFVRDIGATNRMPIAA